MVSRLLDSLLTLASPWGYIVVSLLGGLEAAAFLGLAIPGETAMLFGGVLAFNGRASLPLMIATRSTKELTGARTAGDQAARAFGSTVSGGAG